MELGDAVAAVDEEATGVTEVDGVGPGEPADDGERSGLPFAAGFIAEEAEGETAIVEAAGILLPAGPIFNSRST